MYVHPESGRSVLSVSPNARYLRSDTSMTTGASPSPSNCALSPAMHLKPPSPAPVKASVSEVTVLVPASSVLILLHTAVWLVLFIKGLRALNTKSWLLCFIRYIVVYYIPINDLYTIVTIQANIQQAGLKIPYHPPTLCKQ